LLRARSPWLAIEREGAGEGLLGAVARRVQLEAAAQEVARAGSRGNWPGNLAVMGLRSPWVVIGRRLGGSWAVTERKLGGSWAEAGLKLGAAMR